jgi:hypothetical protein
MDSMYAGLTAVSMTHLSRNVPHPPAAAHPMGQACAFGNPDRTTKISITDTSLNLIFDMFPFDEKHQNGPSDETTNW